MANLFSGPEAEVPLEQLVAKLNKPSPEFLLWLRVVEPDDLERILKVLIQKGVVKDKQEGLGYLQQIAGKVGEQDINIVHHDFGGEKHTAPFRELQKLLQVQTPDQDVKNHFRLCGMASHGLICDFLIGRLPDYERIQRILNTARMSFRPRKIPVAMSQQRFFDKGENAAIHAWQGSLFAPEEDFMETVFFSEILPGNKISDKLEDRVTRIWQQIINEISNKDICQPLTVYDMKDSLRELYLLLLPIFEPQISFLERKGFVLTDLAFALTLLSWASIVVSGMSKDGKRILFREVPIKPGIGGGRIDAIEIFEINGQPPSGWQLDVLKTLSEKRYSSSGHLILELIKKFGPSIRARIFDWKFAVGDGGPNSILRQSDVESLIVKHHDQIKRYLTLANLDFYLSIDGSENRAWNLIPYFCSGRLVYFLPNVLPITREIQLSPSEQEEFFAENIAAKIRPARIKAIVRLLNNAIVGHSIGLIKIKNGPVNKKTVSSCAGRGLFGETAREKLDQILEKFQRFADPYRIIEIIGKDRKGQPKYSMSLKRLVEVMSENSRLDQPRILGHLDVEQGGGLISCLMPDHDDSTPSMGINLTLGLFKCFGCGVYGFFTDTILPGIGSRSHVITRHNRYVPQTFQKSKGIIIPDAHHCVMLHAQRILADSFLSSNGRKYLESRGVDPRLALEKGVGFADSNLIDGLLDLYGYDELIHYGFAAISGKISSVGGICPLLAKRGMAIAQMKREIDIGGKKSFGLPYSTLNNRLTFPLSYEGRMTNFYGRATWSDPSDRTKHRKLTRKYTGVPHGAYNEKIVRSDAPEMLVAEGAIDALSLMQMGHTSTMALIGVDNQLIIELLARSGKNLAFAFDFDSNKYQTGQTNTNKIINRLRNLGYAGQLRNFSEDFARVHPEFGRDCKDFNEWWCRFGENN